MSDAPSGIHAPEGRRAVLAVDALTEVADRIVGVRRGDLAPGDRVLVATRNSIYSLSARPDGSFTVSGGFYARSGRGEQRLQVHGCTAGGSALFTDLVAAPGLFLELSDGTQTTRIVSVRLIRGRGSSRTE